MEILNKNYVECLEKLKQDINAARFRAHLAVNSELIRLYWRIGKEILDKQKELGWGAKVIEQISQDLRSFFPDMKGLSTRNLKYMRAFAAAYQDEPIVQQVAAQLPWFHHCVILDNVKELNQRLWYIQKTIENGWSRNVLVLQVESKLFERQGKALTNFSKTLPAAQSDLAIELIKNSYNLEFLAISKEAKEREIEKSLTENITKFLLELGKGFAFIGTQYKLVVEDDEFFIDILFYHLKLRCYVAIELKAGKFRPEYVGKMGFYLAALDNQITYKSDKPSLGLILCQSHKGIIVEYALQGSSQPIGIANYKLSPELENALPTTEELQQYLTLHREGK